MTQNIRGSAVTDGLCYASHAVNGIFSELTLCHMIIGKKIIQYPHLQQWQSSVIKCVKKTFLLKFVIYDIKAVMITNGCSWLALFHLLSLYPKLHQFTKFSVHVACGHGWYAMQRWREYDVQCMLKQTDSPGQQWGWSLISTLCLRKTTQTWPAITLEMHQLMLM